MTVYCFCWLLNKHTFEVSADALQQIYAGFLKLSEYFESSLLLNGQNRLGYGDIICRYLYCVLSITCIYWHYHRSFYVTCWDEIYYCADLKFREWMKRLLSFLFVIITWWVPKNWGVRYLSKDFDKFRRILGSLMSERPCILYVLKNKFVTTIKKKVDLEKSFLV